MTQAQFGYIKGLAGGLGEAVDVAIAAGKLPESAKFGGKASKEKALLSVDVRDASELIDALKSA